MTSAHQPDATTLSPVLRQLAEDFESVSWEQSHGQDVARVPGDDWEAFAQAAKEAGFEMCSDVTAVDWMRSRPERFEVVASLVSMQHRLRLRMITPVGRKDPVVVSITPIWPGAGFGEREVYDMFGIRFEGHPDLTRILMPDDWEGHPLRKDEGVGSVPVQFKASHQVD
ncbi:MAG TPA: NADH-quinone oxidoreductase subunit C [Acidimicrobiia bacterium]|nr:NADH-quinone oxidoreductase subunit C [Acidimicrobiia bacterium]